MMKNGLWPIRLIGCSLLAVVAFGAGGEEAKSLVERLGFAPEAKLLIVNGDDFGMNHATNQGTISALKQGIVTSSTVMVACPWFPEAASFAREQPKANLGVHTVLTSEWGRYKWGPVLGCGTVPSLCTDQGYFYDDIGPVYKNAKLAEAEQEVRAQIDKALAAGIDVTHIDSHMGTLQYALVYHERYIQIAKDYDLPCRIAGADVMKLFGGEELTKMADDLGVLHPDMLYMHNPPTIEATESWWRKNLAAIQPGKVSEFYIHCGQLTAEMKATTGSAGRRTADTEFFCRPETAEFIREQGIELVSYRELRHLQRKGVAMPRVERYGWE